MPATPVPSVTREEVLARARALAPRFAARAQAAEEARRLPPESANDMLEAGLARILLPPRIGGYGLSFDTWFDVMRELSKADASHGWCAGLLVHHAHMAAQFSQDAQNAVWAASPDVAIAASVAPNAKAVAVEGGYRISSAGSPFASGVDHSSWFLLGGMADDGAGPEWKFFLLPAGECAVRDTWFTAGMRATGSKTIVVDNVFVPHSRALRLTELRDGSGPGAAVNTGIIFRTPFYYYAPLTFVAPMLGAAQGAYELFREWTKTRKAMDGSAVAELTSIQVRMARAAADIDAAELLLRRAAQVTQTPQDYCPQLMARSVRDFTRAAELAIATIDTLIGMSGTAGFASSHPIQRAWRDIHFMSSHISLNPETNFKHFGRLELGLGRDGSRPYF